MKHMLMTLTCALLCGACMGTEPQPAAQAGTVAAALQSPEAVYITEARPDTSARFYIYLCSASWCAPCRAIMPKVVEQYPAIKQACGELILLCFDSTPEGGRKYVGKYNAKFPAMMNSSWAVSKTGLPGYKAPRGIPHAVFVAKDGKVLHAGHGASVLGWQEIAAKLK